MSKGVIEYLEQDLNQAEGHLVAFKDGLEKHVSTDFAELEADLRALVAHGEEKVAALKAKLFGVKAAAAPSPIITP
jgi:predicted regulator of Ras-like GTPase activity (Roadblock/LC7/MglB family)